MAKTVMRNFDDTTIICYFVEHLKNNGYPDIRIERIPDKEKVGGDKKKDIDAIAGNFAIEHTSVDTIKNQTRDSARFLKVVKDLEAEISPKLNYRLNLTIPYEGIRKGQNWSSVSEALKQWIINTSPNLTDGRHIIDNASNIPFQFYARKAKERKPGLFFGRLSPDNNDFVDRLRNQIQRKAIKLKPYSVKGYQTILLLESDDIALMDEGIMLDGVRKSFNCQMPNGVNEIWYADTGISDNIVFNNFTEAILKAI